MPKKTCYTVATMSDGASMRQSRLTGVARWISRLGMNAPAIFFLELHRPLSAAAGQAALFFSPFLAFLADEETVERFARWLSDEDGIDQLIRRLESGA